MHIMYVYVCVQYIGQCVYIYVCLYECMQVQMYVYVCVYYVCKYVCTYVYVYVYNVYTHQWRNYVACALRQTLPRCLIRKRERITLVKMTQNIEI